MRSDAKKGKTMWKSIKTKPLPEELSTFMVVCILSVYAFYPPWKYQDFANIDICDCYFLRLPYIGTKLKQGFFDHPIRHPSEGNRFVDFLLGSAMDFANRQLCHWKCIDLHLSSFLKVRIARKYTEMGKNMAICKKNNYYAKYFVKMTDLIAYFWQNIFENNQFLK